MWEFVSEYGLWIVLGVVFLTMHRFGGVAVATMIADRPWQ